MKKLLQWTLILFIIISCSNKNNIESKYFEEDIEQKSFKQIELNKKLEYLKTNVFFGLDNLNNGFDSELIYYFSESDFEIVLDRVEKNGISIFGIEPWLNGEFYDVLTYEDYETHADDSEWYRKAFEEFKKTDKELMYAASYEIPKELLNK